MNCPAPPALQALCTLSRILENCHRKTAHRLAVTDLSLHSLSLAENITPNCCCDYSIPKGTFFQSLQKYTALDTFTWQGTPRALWRIMCANALDKVDQQLTSIDINFEIHQDTYFATLLPRFTNLRSLTFTMPYNMVLSSEEQHLKVEYNALKMANNIPKRLERLHLRGCCSKQVYFQYTSFLPVFLHSYARRTNQLKYLQISNIPQQTFFVFIHSLPNALTRLTNLDTLCLADNNFAFCEITCILYALAQKRGTLKCKHIAFREEHILATEHSLQQVEIFIQNLPEISSLQISGIKKLTESTTNPTRTMLWTQQDKPVKPVHKL